MAKKGLKVGDQFVDGDRLFTVLKVLEDGAYEAEMISKVPDGIPVETEDDSVKYVNMVQELEGAKKALDDQRSAFHDLVKKLPLEKMNKAQLMDIATEFGIPVTEDQNSAEMIAAIVGAEEGK